MALHFFFQVSILSAMELIWNLCEILFVEAAAGEHWTILMFRLKDSLFACLCLKCVSYFNMFQRYDKCQQAF